MVQNSKKHLNLPLDTVCNVNCSLTKDQCAVRGLDADNASESKVHLKIKSVLEGVQAPSFHQLCNVVQCSQPSTLEMLPFVDNTRQMLN